MTAVSPEVDRHHMRRALELAGRGLGFVEPNPMVGCVIAHDDAVIGEGWHQQYGGPHAEIYALRVAGAAARDATMYVTLEPCCHHGKTPPCSQAIVESGIGRVVVAMRDPFPQVAGGGIQQLAAADISVEVGLLESESRRLNAPYLKLIATGQPWLIAKWAMTLDGKIATPAGDSRWISNDASRAIVHRLRGRVDAILIGRGTAERDDPLLTARPAGARVATRVVADSHGVLSTDSQLARTVADAPLLVACGPAATTQNIERLTRAGVEVFRCDAAPRRERLAQLLTELGRRRMTNVLVEGGATLLGELWSADTIDEIHTFIAPKLIGGSGAASPIGGQGLQRMSQARRLAEPRIEHIEGDVYVSGRLTRGEV